MTPVVMAILVPGLYLVFHRFYARGVLSRRVFVLTVWGICRERAGQTA